MLLKLLTTILLTFTPAHARHPHFTMNVYQSPSTFTETDTFKCFECKLTMNYLRHIDYTQIGNEFCETLPKEHYETCEYYVNKYASDINSYMNDTDSLCSDIDMC